MIRRLAPRAAGALGVAAALAGCQTVGPDHAAPAATVPPAYTEAAPAPAPDPADLTRWWSAFDDPRLDALVEAALAGNPDLQTAASRIREARAVAEEAGARGDPRLDAQGQASRTRISENAIALPPGPGGGAFGLPGSEFNQFRLGFDAAWELDLFGGARRGREAAAARVEAAELTAADVRVSLAAEVAAVYLDLRALQRREATARAEAERQQALLALRGARAGAGFTTRGDPQRQAAAAQAAAAAIAPLIAQQKARIHALAVLTGQAPGALGDLSGPVAVTAPPAPPPGLPSELLRRRPDIRAAERRVAAASADIGVATADLYPRFSLTAQPALVSTDLSSLLDWGSRAYGISAGVIWPLLDGGRTKARIAQADERHVQALIAYRKSVLVALKEVEDALSRLAADQERRDRHAAALSAARAAHAIAEGRARAGLTNASPVLEAEGVALQAEDQLIQAEAAVAQGAVALAKALGGGWTVTDTPGAPS